MDLNRTVAVTDLERWPGSALEHAGVYQALLGGVPAVLRVGGGQRREFGPDLRAVAGTGQDPDLLDERVRIGAQVQGLAVGQVAHVGVPALVQRDHVLELAQYVQGTTSSAGLAGTDGRARGLGGVARHGGTP